MTSPLITLLLLLLGLGAGVLLVGSVFRTTSWPATAALVGVVLLAAALPVELRESSRVLNVQRVSNAGVSEPAARERCLNDMGRTDLVDALAFAREQIPEEARFSVRTTALSPACFALNLLPRLPAPPDDFDPARDWTILDHVPPETVGLPSEDGAPPGRYLTHSASFVLVRPGAEAGR